MLDFKLIVHVNHEEQVIFTTTDVYIEFLVSIYIYLQLFKDEYVLYRMTSEVFLDDSMQPLAAYVAIQMLIGSMKS